MSSSIDINTSKRKKKLVFTSRRNWSNLFSHLMFFITLSFLVVSSILVIVNLLNTSKPNERAFSSIPMLIMLFSLYAIYRRLKASQLILINTSLPKAIIKQVVVAYLTQKNMKYHVHKNHIEAKDSDEFSTYHIRWVDYTFIYDDAYLSFNINRTTEDIAMPIFFTHYFVKREISKLLQQKELEVQEPDT